MPREAPTPEPDAAGGARTKSRTSPDGSSSAGGRDPAKEEPEAVPRSALRGSPGRRRLRGERSDSCSSDKRRSVDCSTLTELHSSSQVPEVEVISLLGEELPKYRLRADYLTEFGGYGHTDFSNSAPSTPSSDSQPQPPPPVVETPALSAAAAGEARKLTAEQVRKKEMETNHFFAQISANFAQQCRKTGAKWRSVGICA